jgi:hypothetical protein
MSATRSNAKQPSPTVTDQLEDVKHAIEEHMKAIQGLLIAIQAQLDLLT